MKSVLLGLFPLLLILGGSLLGWLARWYRDGGRCGPGGLAQGVPMPDIEGNVVWSDGSISSSARDNVASVAGGTRASLVTARDSHDDGMSDTDDSVTAKVAATVAGAVSSAQDTAAQAVEAAKSVATPLTDGTARARIADMAENAAHTVKDAAAGAADGAKSSVVALKDGYAEGRAPDETRNAPADDSVAARAGATIGSAVSSISDEAGGATEAVKDAATRAVDTAKSSLSALGEGYSDPDAPADGSVAARVGALAGGAVSTVQGAVSGVAGATIGQEDGHKIVGDETAAEDHTARMRTRFATLADKAAGDEAMGGGVHAEAIDVPEALSEAEREAERLIESDEPLGRPVGALAAPKADRAVDDLKLIKGIGPKIEETLNGEGIYYFDQIAEFSGRDLAWADRTLGFRGRVVRDRWVPQARGLAAQRDHAKLAATVSYRGDEGASGDADVNTRLSSSETEALRLIERDGGYAATDRNRPAMLMRDGPVGGKPDDLKRIKGIGNKMEGVLNGIGIYYFRQIASFGATDIAWIDSKLSFRGRIIRDRWVPQAGKFEENRNARY